MLVALGDKPARRTRTGITSADTQTSVMQRLTRHATQGAKAQVTPLVSTTGARAVQPERATNSASAQPDPAQKVRAAEGS